MGLKRRLVVAFLILLMVPALMLSVIGTVTARYQRQVIQKGHVDGEEEEVLYYVIRQQDKAEPQITLPFFRAIFILVLIILCTAMVLVLWLYRSIIRPLNVLSAATHSMQEGDFNFTISGDPSDELGRLCEEFEEMRVKMKDQIDARLKYERDTIELISNISHDLKTPLTAIKGYSEGIMDGVADTEEKRNKYLRTIYNKASDMQVLVDELAYYSKIDSNIVPYNFKKLDVRAYFDDCIEEQSLDMEVKNIKLTYTTDVEAGVSVYADPEQLKRVINNVIGNSLKYMDKEEGAIDLQVLDEDCSVRINITDNGAGIEPEALTHIFERFYRADASRGSQKGGTGLGLAIAKKVIEDHGGTISADSTLGQGTTISFTVPKCKKCEVQCSDIEDADYQAVEEKERRSKWLKQRF